MKSGTVRYHDRVVRSVLRFVRITLSFVWLSVQESLCGSDFYLLLFFFFFNFDSGCQVLIGFLSRRENRTDLIYENFETKLFSIISPNTNKTEWNWCKFSKPLNALFHQCPVCYQIANYFCFKILAALNANVSFLVLICI